MNNLIFPNMQPFRFWCQMALPTVLDDSLSYYEVLNKVVKNLNVINENMTDLAQSMVEPYNPEKAYVPGDYVWKDGKIYKCVNKNYGSWNLNDWMGDKVFTDFMATDFNNLKSEVRNQLIDYNVLINSMIYSVAKNYDPTHNYQAGDYISYVPEAEYYDEDETYSRGDFCVYDNYIFECDTSSTTGTFDPSAWKIAGVMYKCLEATTGTFNPSKWTSTIIIDEVFSYMTTMWAAFIADYQRTFGIVQTTGDSVTDAMSQKAVTDTINLVENKILDGFYGAEIRELKTSGWEQGAIRTTIGTTATSNNRIRSDEYAIINNRIGFHCEDGYKYMIFVYTSLSYSSYIGTYQRNGVTVFEASWQTGTTFITLNENYYFKIVVAKTDDSDFTPEDFEAFSEIFSTDKKFNTSGVPADSKKVGETFNTVNDALFNGVASIKTPIYEHSGYISENQWVKSSSKYCLIIPIDNSAIEIKTGNHSNDIAMLKTFSMTSPPDFSNDENWNYFVNIPANTSKLITSPSDAKYFYIYIGTKTWYPNLKINGYSYSESLQDNFNDVQNEIDSYNSGLVKKYKKNKSNTTVDGITYNINNGVIHYEGTATDNIFIELEGNTSTIPSWVKNNRYYAKLTKTNPDETRYQLSAYETDQPTKLYCSSRISTYFTIDNIENKNGVISRIWIPRGETVNNDIKIEILTSIPNNEIETPNESTACKIRIMQYNIGKFNMGQTLSEEYRYLTPSNYQEIFDNYKKLFGHIQPDIIGIEEFENTITLSDGETTISTNDLIFNKLYPYKKEHTDIISKRSLKSKFKLVSSASKAFDYSYIYNGVTVNDSILCIYGKIEIYNKIITVVTTALNGGANDESEIKRQYQLKAIMDFFENDDYVFIVCDANNAGHNLPYTYEDTVTSGNLLNHTAVFPNGYDSSMGSYFPWTKTYKSFNISGKYAAIDNIFYKDNGKIKIVNFEALFNERENLASDHAPVYADFLLF